MVKPRPRRASFSFAGLGVAILAWAVPGLGHLVLGRWRRALAFFVSVGGLALTGYLLRGNVFPQHATDAFGRLGFYADLGTGVFYYLAHFFERPGLAPVQTETETENGGLPLVERGQ